MTKTQDGDFDINSVTTFKCKFGDTQTRENNFGFLERFRKIT